MSHPHPERLALAALTWARLERVLTDAGLLPDRLQERRAEYIRVLVDALDGVPVPPPLAEPVSPVPLPPPMEGAGVAIAERPAGVAIAERPAGVAIQRRPISSYPGWVDPSPDAPSTPRSGPGFSCRECGARVRRARHTDPRLICLQCLAAGSDPSRP